jgi:hypothetical protein
MGWLVAGILKPLIDANRRCWIQQEITEDAETSTEAREGNEAD